MQFIYKGLEGSTVGGLKYSVSEVTSTPLTEKQGEMLLNKCYQLPLKMIHSHQLIWTNEICYCEK